MCNAGKHNRRSHNLFNIALFWCVPLQNTPQNDATRGDEDSEVTILRQELEENYSFSKRKKCVHF